MGTILYVGGFELPDKNASAHRVLNNAKIFRKLGYEVVFCGYDKDIIKDKKEADIICEFKSFPAKRYTSVYKKIVQLFSIKHIMSVINRFEDVEAIICYNLHAVQLAKLLKYGRKKRIKIIADSTEWYSNNFSFHPIKFLFWLDTNASMRYLQKKVDGMITISSFLTNYYKEYIDKIVQIPPLVDIDDEIWKQHPYCDKNKKYVSFIYCGVPGKDKDRLDIIINQLYKLNEKYDFIFNVVGIEKSEYIKRCPSLEEKLDKLGSKVNFYGYQSHCMSINMLFESDFCIFLRPRIRKNMAGFPTKFVECITSGIKVLTNDFSNIKEFFCEKDGMIINELSEQSVCDLIESALNNYFPYKHEVSDRFDYRRYINDMKRLL